MDSEGDDANASQSTEVTDFRRLSLDEVDSDIAALHEQPHTSSKMSLNVNLWTIKEAKGGAEPFNRMAAPGKPERPSPSGTPPRRSKSQPERASPSSTPPLHPFLPPAYQPKSGRLDKQGSKPPNLINTGNFIYIVIPPDGGMGWLILFVVFLCSMCIEGVIWTIGLKLPAIAEDLSLDASDLGFVASMQMALLGSSLINKLGFRLVAFCSAIIGSVAMFCCSFSETKLLVTICFGVIGLSLGTVLVSSILIIHYYFESLRPIASSISSTGSGVGLIVISNLNAKLIASHGWRYTSRVHVLMLLAVALLTCTYAEVEPTEISGLKFIPGDDSEESLESIELNTQNYSLYSLTRTENQAGTSLAAHESGGSGSKSQRRYCRRLCASCWRCCCSCCCCCRCCCRRRKDSRHVINRNPLDRPDIFYSGPPDYTRSASIQGVRISYTLSLMRTTNKPEVEGTETRIPQKLKAVIFTLLEIKLMALTEFKLLMLNALVYSMGVNIPFVYGIPRAEIPVDLANLLPSTIGVVNIIFRLMLGVCAYKSSIHMSYISSFGLCLSGGAILASGFYGQNSVPLQFLFAGLFGYGIASYGALRTVIYVQVLGLDRLTNAFGLTTAIMGVGLFIGTYLAGRIVNYYECYDPAFIFSGICLILAGTIQLIIPKYMAYSSRQKKSQKKVRFRGTNGGKCSQCWGIFF